MTQICGTSFYYKMLADEYNLSLKKVCISEIRHSAATI